MSGVDFVEWLVNNDIQSYTRTQESRAHRPAYANAQRHNRKLVGDAVHHEIGHACGALKRERLFVGKVQQANKRDGH
jgi:hypothetical protein